MYMDIVSDEAYCKIVLKILCMYYDLISRNPFATLNLIPIHLTN